MLGLALRIGNLTLDTVARQVLINGGPRQFSAQEVRLLELLLRRAGSVISKKHVEDELFGREGEIGASAADVAVHRLRRRLKTETAKLEIHTVRGVGYFIAEGTT